jgi:ABC-type sugar transport system ATPase subunit
VTLVEPLGSTQIVHMAPPGAGELVASLSARPSVRPGRTLAVRIPPQAVHLFDAVSGRSMT